MREERADAGLHQYDSLFYEYQRSGSARSARAMLTRLAPMQLRSVLDVGCGAGAWLAEHARRGIEDFIGVDGDYVDRKMLLVPESRFLPVDIAQPFDLGRQFDLVQCLEVAEHVPASRADTLIDNLVKHGKRVLFSAAVPGQGGEDHVNEQPYEYWRDRFATRGYRLFDFLRQQVCKDADIEPWYRYNVLFFAHDDVVALLPEDVIACRIEDGAPVRDFSPLSYRLRKAILRNLPAGAVTTLAVLKHKLAVRSAGGR